MLSRIKHILKERSITQEQLAAAAGVSKWQLTKQLRGVYKLNIDVILALLRLCPDVSADWLLMGRGDCTRTDTRDIIIRLDNLSKQIDKLTNN